jgi:hypothetical protein
VAVGTPALVRRTGPPRGGNLSLRWSAVALLLDRIAALEASLNGKLATLALAGKVMEKGLYAKLASIWEATGAADERTAESLTPLRQGWEEGEKSSA